MCLELNTHFICRLISKVYNTNVNQVKFTVYYLIRMLNFITVGSKELWPPESYYHYCRVNKISYTQPDKIECQKLCEQNGNCVGISYTNNGKDTHICYVCLDDTLSNSNAGFNFYRKPGI